MFDDRWFHVTWFLTYRTFDAILGHISVLDEIYKSSWSCMLIPTCEMYAETMTCSLFYHDPSVEPLWIYSARPTFFSIWLPSCLLFQETFHRCLGLIWIMKIAHLMMDDFMSPDFWPIVHLVPYWGIFMFWMRVIDLHGAVWSLPLMGCAPRRWPVRYFYDDSLVEHPRSHPIRPALLGA